MILLKKINVREFQDWADVRVALRGLYSVELPDAAIERIEDGEPWLAPIFAMDGLDYVQVEVTQDGDV